MIPGNWLENPSDSRQESYVKAENVYHSFVLDSYTDISDELKERIHTQIVVEKGKMGSTLHIEKD